jgi:hypothetical protein
MILKDFIKHFRLSAQNKSVSSTRAGSLKRKAGGNYGVFTPSRPYFFLANHRRYGPAKRGI